MTEFKIEYYDSGTSSWVEVSDWINLSIKYPNGILQLAPTAQFTTDKDTTFSTHQKIRISSVASDGTTTLRFTGYTKSEGSINSNGNRDIEVRGYGYEVMKKAVNIDLTSTDTISVLEEAVSGTSYTIDSSNATSKSMSSYLIQDGKVEDVFTDILSEGPYIYRIGPSQTIYIEDIDGRGEYASIDVQSDPAAVGDWEAGHIDTVVNKAIGQSVVEYSDSAEWSNDLGEKQFSIDRDGDKLYISGVGDVRCLDIDDGSVLWTETVESGENIRGLSIEGGLMLIGTDNGKVKLYEIGSSGLTLLDSHTQHGTNIVTRVLFRDNIALSLGYDETLVYATYEFSSDTLTVQDDISTTTFGFDEATGLGMRGDQIIASISAKIYIIEYDESAGTLSQTTTKDLGGDHKGVIVYDKMVFVCYDNYIAICSLRDGRLETLTQFSLTNDTVSIDIDDDMVVVGHEDSGAVSYLEYDSDPKSLSKVFETDIHGGSANNNQRDILMYNKMIYSPSQQGTVYSYYASDWKELTVIKEDSSSISSYGERSERYNLDWPQTPGDLEDAIASRLQPEPEPKGSIFLGGTLDSGGKDIVNYYITLTDASMNISSQQMTIDEQVVTPQGTELTLGGAAVAGARRMNLKFRSREDIDRISYETVRRL